MWKRKHRNQLIQDLRRQAMLRDIAKPQPIRPTDLLYMDQYAGLSSTCPSQDGGNITEPTTGGYTRVKIDINSRDGNGNLKLTFPPSTGAWLNGTPLSHFFLADAITGGNVYYHGILATRLVMFVGDTVTIEIDKNALGITDGIDLAKETAFKQQLLVLSKRYQSNLKEKDADT